MIATMKLTSYSGARGHAGLAGAVCAAASLGVTELAAGLWTRVPSAVAAIGSVVIDRSPAWVKDFAITFFGTADKGALEIGTVLLGLLFGALIGRLALRRPWMIWAGFGVFGILGIAAALDRPLQSPAATILVIGTAAGMGGSLLWWLLRPHAAAEPAQATGKLETPADLVPVSASRRGFIVTVAGVGVAAVLAGAIGRNSILRRADELRAGQIIPAPVRRLAPPEPAHSFDVGGLGPIVVPNDSFYRIDTELIVPRVDPKTWRLSVTGMVDRELEMTLDELLSMPLYEEYVTIACVSNEVGGNLVGNARWTGVMLTDVLERAGVKQGADQIVGRAVSGWTAGFPTALAFDGREPLIAVAMNGEPLPAKHGFPARLIVPGLYGYVSATKWLEEIELTTWDSFDAYWIPRGWAKTGPIKTQSRIDFPRNNEKVTSFDAVFAGVAWAPLKGIAAVEVQIDDEPWVEADLSEPLSDKSWVQWRVQMPIAMGRRRVRVRAKDGTGDTQTEVETPPRPDGATGYHTIGVEAV